MTYKKPTPYFYGYKIILYPFHIHNGVENVLKHVLFNVHDVKVMVEKIGLPIRKLPNNISLNPIVGQTKTRKLLLIGLKTKHNVTILQHYVIQFLILKKWQCSIPFNSANKEILLVLSVLVICWQELLVAIKKKVSPSFINVNILLFSIQYGHASFTCVLQPETIS